MKFLIVLLTSIALATASDHHSVIELLKREDKCGGTCHDAKKSMLKCRSPSDRTKFHKCLCNYDDKFWELVVDCINTCDNLRESFEKLGVSESDPADLKRATCDLAGVKVSDTMASVSAKNDGQPLGVSLIPLLAIALI